MNRSNQFFNLAVLERAKLSDNSPDLAYGAVRRLLKAVQEYGPLPVGGIFAVGEEAVIWLNVEAGEIRLRILPNDEEEKIRERR